MAELSDMVGKYEQRREQDQLSIQYVCVHVCVCVVCVHVCVHVCVWFVCMFVCMHCCTHTLARDPYTCTCLLSGGRTELLTFPAARIYLFWPITSPNL